MTVDSNAPQVDSPPEPEVVAVAPDWERAVYLMLKAMTHAFRSLDAVSGGDPELQRMWWTSSIEAEHEAMGHAGERAKEEGPSEEEPSDPALD